MRSDRTRIPFARRSPPPPAGYTYAGQFIFHDLTRDDTPLRGAIDQDARDTANQNQPSLNLSSLYGDGPGSKDAFLYENDGASLKVGSGRTNDGALFDLPLDPTSLRAILADPRNNESLILRQIHAMFLKLHNSAVTVLRDEASGVDLFEEARRRVRWQFQWLVRFDYLPRICDPSVYRDIIIDGNRRFDWPSASFSIPVEFSHGAARFGHSMVRAKYDLNHGNLDVSLNRIIREVHKPGPLDPAFAIDWQRFFTAREPANNLDTTIPEAMFQLPIEALRRFGASISEDNPAELPVRTLRRGAAMKLPTGEQVRDAFGSPSIVQGFEGLPNYAPAQVLADLGLNGRTPLWFYILLEAEANARGANLGPVGSRLIAEVIEGALHADLTSIVWELKRNPSWRPPEWKTPTGEALNIDSFLDLAVAVGLADAFVT
jgi:hypothetical protein